MRHHAWRDHWFKINCTTDLCGGFVETTAPDDVPPFTFNCDIATPMVRRGDRVFAVDLWLDVLVRGDGVTHGVHDHDDFDGALRRGWLSERDVTASIGGQVWRVAWCPPPDPPPGTRHGAEAICVTDGRVVLVSRGGRLGGLPAGRPEQSEGWVDTLRREVREEACAEVVGCRLLGFARGVCVRGRRTDWCWSARTGERRSGC